MATTQTSERDDLEKIYRAAVAAVEPARLVGLAIDGGCPGAERVPDLIAGASRVLMLAVGKAAAGMAREIERRIGDKLADALAVIPRPSAATTERALILKTLKKVAAGHPVPDQSSEEAARLACEMLRGATADDLVIVAISGGASAMFVRPAEGLALADKIAVNEAMLKAGASIRELNIVRKHLSAVKGGHLLRYCGGARVLGLILSDVPGNDLATIGSGLTAGDSSSCSDAVAVMKRRGVWGRAPEAVRSYLERAAAGEIGETVKPGDPILERVTNVIVGDNNVALEAAERAAAELGYHPRRWKPIHGEANDAGRALAEYMGGIADERVCVVAGGEPVVTVRGGGKGGRAQQCALAMGIELSRIGQRKTNRGAVRGNRRNRRADGCGGSVRVAEHRRGRRSRGSQRRGRVDSQRLVQLLQGVGRTVRNGADRDQRQRRFYRTGELLRPEELKSMQTQPASKIGPIAAIAGAVMLMVGTYLHPMSADPNVPIAAFTEYAASDNWVAIHLMQLFGVILIAASLVLLSRRLADGPASRWAALGAAGAIASVAVASALQAVDGVALKVMVDTWASTPQPGRASMFDAAFGVRQIEVGLASMTSLLLGLTASIYGIALMIDQRFPRWVGVVAIVGGVPTAIAGVVMAHTGFSNQSMVVGMPSNLMLVLWMIALGVCGLRRNAF